MLWAVVRKIIAIPMARTFMVGIKTGLLTGMIITGLHRTMRPMVPVHASASTSQVAICPLKLLIQNIISYGKR